MTKSERRKIQLSRHYERLAALAAFCGVNNPDGKKLSVKLLKLEKLAQPIILDYANGENGINTDNIFEKLEPIKGEVLKLFNNRLEGFFINTDPRGNALKIKDNYFRQGGKYEHLEIYKDWGGYGILAPEITGN